MNHHAFSPSKLGRLKDCSGSAEMEAKADAEGVRVESTAAEAAQGTEEHKRLPEGVPIDDLSTDSQEAIETTRQYIAAKAYGSERVLYEQEVVLWDPESKEPLTWGSIDVLILGREALGIVDYKGGRGTLSIPHVELQQRIYAGAAMQEYGRSKAKVWVYQPRESFELFGAYGDVDAIVAEVREIIRKIRESPGLLVPSGDACRYCRGKAICPAFNDAVLRLPTTRETLAMIDPSAIGRILDLAQLVEPWAKAVRERAKGFMQAGLEVPGWSVAERNVREVVDPAGIRRAVSDVLTPEEIDAACEPSITALEDQYARKARDGGTLKAAKERFAAVTRTCIRKTPQVYLKRKERDQG